MSAFTLSLDLGPFDLRDNESFLGQIVDQINEHLVGYDQLVVKFDTYDLPGAQLEQSYTRLDFERRVHISSASDQPRLVIPFSSPISIPVTPVRFGGQSYNSSIDKNGDSIQIRKPYLFGENDHRLLYEFYLINRRRPSER